MNKTSYVIINGHVIDPANNRSEHLNIFIDNGKISEVSSRKPSKDAKIINSEGFVVTQGFIDLHTHLRDPGFQQKEDIESGSMAAAAGGFTSIFCMANTKPVNDNTDVLKYINDKAKKLSKVKIYPVSAISKNLEGKKLVDLKSMSEAGVLAVSDDGFSVKDRSLMKMAMELAQDLDLLVISHPEDLSLSRNGVMNEGRISRKLGLEGISHESEEKIIDRNIELAVETGVRLHIAHLSTKRGIEIIREAKRSGSRVTCEVTPHHLLLTENDLTELNPNMKMKPPLRTDEDREALLEGIVDGTVDAIATDHAPHEKSNSSFALSLSKGERGACPPLVWRGAGEDSKIPLNPPFSKGEFIKAPFGVIGMETALPVCMKLVEKGKISLERLIELLTSGPARAAKIDSGTLSIGSPADIVIFSMDKKYKIDSSQFRSKSRNTPFDGWEVSGRVINTIVDGSVVYSFGDK